MCCQKKRKYSNKQNDGGMREGHENQPERFQISKAGVKKKKKSSIRL